MLPRRDGELLGDHERRRILVRSATLILLILSMATLLASGCAAGDGTRGTTGGDMGSTSGSGTTSARTIVKGEGEGSDGEARQGMVANMSLREAVGQMFIVSVEGTSMNPYTRRAIQERKVGGILLFGLNMQSEPQVRSLTASMQSVAGDSGAGVPLLIAADQEGGPVSNASWVSQQPAAAEVGARGDTAEAKRIARTIGLELREAGVNTDFAPVVDTGGGAAIGSRSYGDEPALVGRMGAASVEGFREAGVMSAAKHFPNHGPATADSHTGRPVVGHDMTTVREYDLPPFRAAVNAGAPMVMAAHLVYPAIDPELPASLSPEALRLLREELGFEGVIVTDDLSMEAATRGGTVSGAAVDAVRAGADAMILSGTATDQAAAYEAVVRAVESGEIPRESIYESAERIVEMKREYDLYRDTG